MCRTGEVGRDASPCGGHRFLFEVPDIPEGSYDWLRTYLCVVQAGATRPSIEPEVDGEEQPIIQDGSWFLPPAARDVDALYVKTRSRTVCSSRSVQRWGACHSFPVRWHGCRCCMTPGFDTVWRSTASSRLRFGTKPKGPVWAADNGRTHEHLKAIDLLFGGMEKLARGNAHTLHGLPASEASSFVSSSTQGAGRVVEQWCWQRHSARWFAPLMSMSRFLNDLMQRANGVGIEHLVHTHCHGP